MHILKFESFQKTGTHYTLLISRAKNMITFSFSTGPEPKKPRLSTVGWPINPASGKVYLDRKPSTEAFQPIHFKYAVDQELQRFDLGWGPPQIGQVFPCSFPIE